MLLFLLRRLLSSLIVLFFAVSLTFLLTRSLPGGPFDKEKAGSAKVQEALLEKYQLQGSLWQQYTAYLRDLAHLDLRVSFKYRDWSVAEILAQKMPSSLKLGGIAFLMASTLGVLLGGLAAMRRDTPVDWAMMFGAIIAISVPSFITGPFLVAVFALWLLDVMKSDFLRTARAKGLTETQALTRHAMKVAILPVVTYLGPLAAHLLTGSMIVESVFNISGAGSIFVNSIQNRDAFLLCGAVVIYCSLLIVFNFTVDLLYSVLDKRIQLYA
jgi:oligopeptide transport system permease protein